MKRPSITVRELQALTGKRERQCRNIANQSDFSYEKQNGGLNGNGRLKVYVDSLPLKIQKLYYEKHPRPKVEIPNENCKPSPYQMQVSNERLEILIGGEGLNGFLGKYCEQNGITKQTFYNWKKAYDENGLAGLCPRYDKRSSKPVHGDIKKFIEKQYCKQTLPTKATVHREAVDFCKSLGIKPITLYQTTKIIEAIPRSAVVRTRKGPKYFEENCGYYIDRDWSQCAVNEIWCGDHRQIDVLVYKNDERNSIGAPWISAWMDMRSRCLVGWHISFSPNSDTVALSFRHGILRAGLPETIYIDNGKDYRSYYFSGNYRKFTNIDFDLQTKSIVNRTGTHVIHALPYNHKAKPIESFFKFMALRFDRGHPGWRGPNPKAKPEKLEHEIKRGELLTFNEFKEKMEAWLEWYNTEHVHSETRRIAQSFYETARVKMITETEANFLLMKKKDYKLGRRGVRLHGIDFFSEDLFDRTLPRDVVEIRWDPRDLSEILIFDDDGFVCKAFAQYPVDARGMSEREWAQQKRYKQIQNAHLMRRVEAIQDPYGEKKKRAKRKLATPKPIAKNGLRLITREGILAQQVDDSAQQKPLIEKTLQEQEMEFMKWVEKQPLKKTGTDDDDFGLFDGIEVESGPYGKKIFIKP